jgi:addiction module RelE/StbE family toxin
MEPSLVLKWTHRSLSDISRIVDYVSQEDPVAALKLAATIRAKAEHLRAHPQLGREVFPGLRELVVHRHYLLTYRIRSGRIEVLQVWHAAQQRK